MDNEKRRAKYDLSGREVVRGRVCRENHTGDGSYTTENIFNHTGRTH